MIEKEFAESILKRVAQLPDTDLAASLASLVQGEFLLEKALYPEAEYAFKHPLTQSVALEGQLRDRRRSVHEKAAKAILAERADRLDEAAALVAHHWEEAGRALEAASGGDAD